MRIRKLIAITAALLLTVLAGTGTAEGGVTLRTISCFAGQDGSADEYVAILQHYESMTGNTVIDSSSVTDEAWKTDILKDFAAGNEPDILFFFAAGADSAHLQQPPAPAGGCSMLPMWECCQWPVPMPNRMEVSNWELATLATGNNFTMATFHEATIPRWRH